MIRFEENYYTSTGSKIPFQVQIERVSRAKVIREYLDAESRSKWCTHCDEKGKGACAQYDTRPCCPPRVPDFEHLRKRKYLYMIHLKFMAEDYYSQYPALAKYRKGGESPSSFFFSNTVRHFARSVLYEGEKLMKQPGDTIFKVGGCMGCTYKLGKGCKTGVSPALEAVGIKVCEVCETVFDSPVQWLGKGNLLDYFTALGGIYTDQELKKEDFKRSIRAAAQLKRRKKK